MAPKTTTSTELQSWLSNHRKIAVIDIRPFVEWAAYRIPNSIHCTAYDKIKANDLEAFEELHLDISIPAVVVCGGGKTSLQGAEILEKLGYTAYSLEGGIQDWKRTTES